MYRIAFMVVMDGRLLSGLYFSSDGRRYTSIDAAIRDAKKQNESVRSLEYIVVSGVDILWQRVGSRVPPNMQAREIPRAERTQAS